MNGLLGSIKDKVKQQYQQGLLSQIINDPSSVGRELGQLFDPKYMSQVKPMSQEQALDLALNAPMMAGTIKPIAKTSYEIAQDVAQKNAALPVSKGGLGLPKNNTAMDRAKAMGFDTENMWFRGDKPNLSEFNPNDPSNYIKGNIFLTDKKPIASWYAKTGKQKDIMNMPSNESEGVYSLFTKINPRELKIDANQSSWADIPVPKAWKKSFYDGTGQIDDVALMANQKKYPSMQVNNVVDQYGLGNQKVIFNPSDIRSINAAFDPFRRNEADILAGIGAMPIGLLTDNKRKEKKKVPNK